MKYLRFIFVSFSVCKVTTFLRYKQMCYTMGFEGVCDMPLRFADGIDDDVYLGNAEVIPNGRMVGRYGRVLTQPMFEGAYINAVGHRKFFQQPRTRVQAVIAWQGYCIVSSTFNIL